MCVRVTSGNLELLREFVWRAHIRNACNVVCDFINRTFLILWRMSHKQCNQYCPRFETVWRGDDRRHQLGIECSKGTTMENFKDSVIVGVYHQTWSHDGERKQNLFQLKLTTTLQVTLAQRIDAWYNGSASPKRLAYSAVTISSLKTHDSKIE